MENDNRPRDQRGNLIPPGGTVSDHGIDPRDRGVSDPAHPRGVVAPLDPVIDPKGRPLHIDNKGRHVTKDGEHIHEDNVLIQTKSPVYNGLKENAQRTAYDAWLLKYHPKPPAVWTVEDATAAAQWAMLSGTTTSDVMADIRQASGVPAAETDRDRSVAKKAAAKAEKDRIEAAKKTAKDEAEKF